MNINTVGELKRVWKLIDRVYVMVQYSPLDAHYFETTKLEIEEQILRLGDSAKLNAQTWKRGKGLTLWIG